MPSRWLVRWRRRLVWVVATLALAVVAVPGLGADSFDDVPSDHTFAADIAWLADEGITRGCNPPQNTRFCPDDYVTRAQMAAFLVRALDLPPADDQGFTDSAGTFKGNIDSLAAAGITRGCNPPTNDRFCPEELVTRGQMAAFLVRALGLPPADDQGFTDSAGTFKGNIDSLAAAGITRGCNPPTNDRFCPDGLVTRGQMAAFLHRALTIEPPIPAKAIDISVGFQHACALSEDGRVYCWGSNNNGKLGVASPTMSTKPIEVPGLSDVVDIAAGNSHTCALNTSGHAYCWGLGASGRLGTGNEASTSTPTRVVGLTGVTAIDAGENFTCALKDNGTVWCWGFGTGGHLGNGAESSSSVPVPVSGITDAVNLDVGYGHACVTTATERAKCWGETGRPGDGGGLGMQLVPIQAILTDVARVSAGHGSTCALTLSGVMNCWGNNGDGQLGTGDTAVRNIPNPVPGMTQVLSIEAGHYTTCAIDSESDTYCWGRNANGTAAMGTRGDDILSPQKALVDRAMMIDLAYDNGCAVSLEGEISCWGDNTLGQLGIGTSGGVEPTPRPVTLP